MEASHFKERRKWDPFFVFFLSFFFLSFFLFAGCRCFCFKVTAGRLVFKAASFSVRTKDLVCHYQKTPWELNVVCLQIGANVKRYDDFDPLRTPLFEVCPPSEGLPAALVGKHR